MVINNGFIIEWTREHNTLWTFPVSFTALPCINLCVDFTGNGGGSAGWVLHYYYNITLSSVNTYNVDNGTMSVLAVGF